jgi:hypothetical protein
MVALSSIQQQQFDAFGFIVPTAQETFLNPNLISDFGFNNGFAQTNVREPDRGISITDIPVTGVRELVSPASAAITPAGPITSTINQIGAQAGFGGVTPSFVGPTLPGTGVAPTAGTITATPLSGVLTGAGIGAGVGSLIGALTGGTPLGSTAGGAVGGAIGSALLPGIGTFVGSALGGAIGGIFGADPKARVSEFAGQISPEGEFTSTFGSKELGTEFGQILSQEFENFSNDISRELGLDLTGSRVFGGINDKQGNILRTDFEGGGPGEARFTFDPRRPESIPTAFGDLTIELLERKQGQPVDEDTRAQIQNFVASRVAGTGGAVPTDIKSDIIQRQTQSGLRRTPTGEITVFRKGTSFSDFVNTHRANTITT